MESNFLSNIIINDFIVHENLCNFRCQYCLGQDIEENCKQQINSDNEINIDVKYNTESDIKKTQDIYEKHINAEIFQIAGGEIFMIDNISEFIEEKSKKYEKVLILTNGYLLNEKIIKKLADCKNIIVAISLDGHTLEMNSYRFKSIHILNQIIENINLLIQNNVSILINMVLHNRNIDKIKDFLNFLSDISSNISVFPIILRGKNIQTYQYDEQKLDILLDIAADKELAGKLAIVPEYFREMYYVCKKGYKSFGCYTSLFATETFHNGEFMCCPLNWIQSLGNILDAPPNKIFEKFGTDKIYNLLIRKSKSLKLCNNCLSHYDVINMYIENVINLETLKRVAFINTPTIIAKIEKFKKMVKK